MKNCPICGKELNNTSAIPYINAIYDNEGNVISGVCIHGVSFGKELTDCEKCFNKHGKCPLKGGNTMELSQKEKELYDLIVSKGEVTIKMIQDNLSIKHVGALGKLLRYEKIELSKNYNRRDKNNKVIKCYTVKKEVSPETE